MVDEEEWQAAKRRRDSPTTPRHGTQNGGDQHEGSARQASTRSKSRDRHAKAAKKQESLLDEVEWLVDTASSMTSQSRDGKGVRSSVVVGGRRAAGGRRLRRRAEVVEKMEPTLEASGDEDDVIVVASAVNLSEDEFEDDEVEDSRRAGRPQTSSGTRKSAVAHPPAHRHSRGAEEEHAVLADARRKTLSHVGVSRTAASQQAMWIESDESDEDMEDVQLTPVSANDEDAASTTTRSRKRYRAQAHVQPYLRQPGRRVPKSESVQSSDLDTMSGIGGIDSVLDVSADGDGRAESDDELIHESPVETQHTVLSHVSVPRPAFDAAYPRGHTQQGWTPPAMEVSETDALADLMRHYNAAGEDNGRCFELSEFNVYRPLNKTHRKVGGETVEWLRHSYELVTLDRLQNRKECHEFMLHGVLLTVM